MTTEQRQKLVTSLRDKGYRDVFAAESINTGLAFQIRELRERREWSQEDLGRHAEPAIAQETVATYENPDYGKFTITTLKRLASAFDVALVVRFAPFSELVDWTLNLMPDQLAPPEFAKDIGLLVATPPVEAFRARLRDLSDQFGETTEAINHAWLSRQIPLNIRLFPSAALAETTTTLIATSSEEAPRAEAAV